MKKKTVIGLIDAELNRLRGTKNHKSFNSLDSDAKTLIDEAISSLEALRAEADGAEEELGVDTIVDRIKDIIDEKINTALEKVKDVTPAPAENYLKSKNAVHDFAKCLRENREAEDMKAAWRKILAKNSITIAAGEEEGYLPELVRSRIEDNWNSDTNWLRRLNHTGAKRFAIRYNEQSQDNTSVRAKGHQKGATKTEQEVTLNSKVISLQGIYKLQKIDKITEFEDDGQLLEWIADELTRQMFYEIGRAILVGDGRPVGDPDQITSFETIDRAATDTFVTVGTYGGFADIMEEYMENLIKPLYEQGGEIILFTNKNDLFKLRQYLSGTGATTRYSSLDEVKAMLGVSDIVVLPYMDDTTSGAARAIAMHPDKYYTVGKMDNFEFLRFPDYKTNEEYFRSETFAGGGAGMNCGAVLRNA